MAKWSRFAIAMSAGVCLLASLSFLLLPAEPSGKADVADPRMPGPGIRPDGLTNIDAIDRRRQEASAVKPDQPGDADLTSVASQALPVKAVLACANIREEIAIRRCLEDALSNSELSGQQLGEILCALNSGDIIYAQVTRMAMSRWSDLDMLRNSSATRSACATRHMDDWLVWNLLQIAEERPGVLNALISELSESRLFSSDASPLLLDLTAALSKKYDDGALRYFLESGARGECGGELAQIDFAILKAVSLQKTDHERVSLLASILYSPALRGPGVRESGIGASLTHSLLEGPSLSGPAGQAAIQLLHSAFADPVFGPGSAAQLVRYGDRDVPAQGVSLQEWRLLWDKAAAVVEKNGIVFN